MAGQDWSDIKPSQASSSYYDVYDRLQFPKGEWVTIRLVGKVYPLTIHWIPVIKKQGGTETAFPQICRKCKDPNEQCPDCDAGISRQNIYLTNAIVRDEQEAGEGKKSKPPKGKQFVEPGDKFFNPVKVVQLPAGAAQKIKNLEKLNKAKDKEGNVKKYPINHEKYGRDITILYDPSQSGSGMYDIQKDDRTKLTKEEKSYLLYNLDKVYEYIPAVNDMVEALKKAYDDGTLDKDNCDLKETKRIVLGKKKFKPGSDDEETTGKKGKKKKKDEEEDEVENEAELDEDEDEEDELEGEEEDEEEGEDELDEDEEDEEEEDEGEDEDEDEDEESEEDEDLEDEEEEDEGEDEDEDEDEEDEDLEEEEETKPTKKKGKSQAKKGKGKGDDKKEDKAKSKKETKKKQEKGGKSTSKSGKSNKKSESKSGEKTNKSGTVSKSGSKTSEKKGKSGTGKKSGGKKSKK